jgi:hypothetical protein
MGFSLIYFIAGKWLSENAQNITHNKGPYVFAKRKGKVPGIICEFYSQQGSLNPQFLQIASLDPALIPIEKLHLGHD